MIDEICALQSSDTWELVPFSHGKSLVIFHWFYTLKVGLDGKSYRFKACLGVKGYNQIFGLDYSDSFSLVAKLASFMLFLAIASIRQCHIHQLDIKNYFLYGDLEDEVYMEKPHRFVSLGE